MTYCKFLYSLDYFFFEHYKSPVIWWPCAQQAVHPLCKEGTLCTTYMPLCIYLQCDRFGKIKTWTFGSVILKAPHTVCLLTMNFRFAGSLIFFRSIIFNARIQICLLTMNFRLAVQVILVCLASFTRK
jgi:hypothetical protein